MRGMQGQYYQYQNGFLDRAVVDLTLTDIADGIYEKWEQYGLLDNIESQEWRPLLAECRSFCLPLLATAFGRTAALRPGLR